MILKLLFLTSIGILGYDAIFAVLHTEDPFWFFIANALGLVIILIQVWMRAGERIKVVPERRSDHPIEVKSRILIRATLFLWIIALNILLGLSWYTTREQLSAQAIFERQVCERQEAEIADIGILETRFANAEVKIKFTTPDLNKYSQERIHIIEEFIHSQHQNKSIPCLGPIGKGM